MDANNVKDFLDKVITKAIDCGFEEAESIYKYGAGSAVSIFEGEVSNYENNSEQHIGFMGKLDKQMGSSKTSIVDISSVDYLVNSALDNHKVKNDEDEDFFYCDKENSDLYFNELSDASYKNGFERFRDTGLELEKAILNCDETIKAVDYLQVGYSKTIRILKNSLGLTEHTEGDLLTIGAEARCEKDGVVKTGYHIWYGRDIDEFKIDEFVSELRQRTCSKLGASSISSGIYKVILSQDAFVSLFSSYASSLSAFSIQKGMSLLKDKVNEVVASSLLTIREIPMYDKALLKFPFDNSGVLTYDKDIFKDGKFVQPLYTLKTAHKDNVKPTGNDFGGAEYTNLVLTPGDKNLEELAKEVGEGLYITDLNGLHAGINAVSGDFSLLCEGFLIKDGRIDHPVEQITVAGNYLDLLKNICAIGSDVKNISDGEGEFFCPSVVIKEMNIAGEAD